MWAAPLVRANLAERACDAARIAPSRLDPRRHPMVWREAAIPLAARADRASAICSCHSAGSRRRRRTRRVSLAVAALRRVEGGGADAAKAAVHAQSTDRSARALVGRELRRARGPPVERAGVVRVDVTRNARLAKRVAAALEADGRAEDVEADRAKQLIGQLVERLAVRIPAVRRRQDEGLHGSVENAQPTAAPIERLRSCAEERPRRRVDAVRVEEVVVPVVLAR